MMPHQVRCDEDLGIQGCDFVASGEAAGDVVDQVVTHIRREHHVKMPAADAILTGAASSDPLTPGMDKAANTVIRRLRETLNLRSYGDLP